MKQGKRRIAFAAHVDEDRLPRLLVLLRSLALTNPAVCEDFLLLHGGLADAAFEPARRLHPRIVPRKAAPAADGAAEPAPRTPGFAPLPGQAAFAALTAFAGDAAFDDYDTIIGLPADAVIAEDIGPLLRTRAPFVPYRPAGRAGPAADPGNDPAGAPAPGREGAAGPAGPGAPEDGADGSGTPAAGEAGHGALAGVAELSDREFYAAYCALPGRKAPELLLHCALPLLREGGPITTRAGKRVDAAGLARVAGSALHQLGRYEEAVEVLTPAAGDPRRARNHEALGSALLALSRYPEAETHLLLATAHPVVAPRAFAQLSRLAWLHGENEKARRHAAQGLDADPTDAGCRAMYARASAGAGEAGDPAAQVAHVALYAEGQENSGDKLLPEAVRRCFGAETGPARWHSVPVHRLVDDALLERLNARRGVLVGGGGLFLPDTWPNGNSGWQWNVPDAALRRITVPLAVFAVGFNLFEGQHFSRTRLAGSLRTLAERAAFFGLRNRGSADRVRELLPAELAGRVRYQPCPTTVIRHLIPGWRDPAPADRADVVLLNCAYDRAGLRFGHDYGHFLGQMARAVRTLRAHSEVRYAAHAPSDETFVHDLRREHGLTLPVEQLYDLPNDRLLDVYRRARLVIGMRGHATMIPFGCGTPALSLVSHPKLAYFLADLDREEWGVSVHAPDLAAELTERAWWLLNDQAAAVADVLERQEALLRVTRENAAELSRLFGGEAPGAGPGVGGGA
ncbi:polysaccharide pyruvyl transferase family protein [Streptomyces hoynatensis]|uniref:Polysaccharide pyruvyl transferase family protein n=1 Tax=Streptomyces hoynatensis TaxID=1141874 RepID=A0A3A9YNZ5_9ACTN|nr:tetratricopeptide repeat-containing glycosyltransferase family protein [Streptomyces hoynatensis]RKN37732.1 polysaccharide pyruvyl transferase family protein [Streptomyces hoynatensis]